MGLKEDITKQTRDIFRTEWSISDGNSVPDENTIKLGNDGVRITATVLYADLADSTEMVRNSTEKVSAEIYKSFLNAICKVITSNSGTITAFDGDRVMAVFMGERPNTDAAKTALQINYTIKEIVQKEYREFYQYSNYDFEYGIGIDTSKILVAKTGIRGSNDLVWVGNSANIAAKLCSLRKLGKRIWITEEVFNKLLDSSKYGGNPKSLMWEKHWSTDLGMTAYGSSWWWEI